MLACARNGRRGGVGRRRSRGREAPADWVHRVAGSIRRFRDTRGVGLRVLQLRRRREGGLAGCRIVRREPLTEALLLSLSVMVIDGAVTGSLKVAVTSVEVSTPVAPEAGCLLVTVGLVVSLALVS